MDSHYADGRGLTEDEITGLLLAGMFAGHHTSSVTTAWALLELLRNPEASRSAASRNRSRVRQRTSRSRTRLLRELSFTENVRQGTAAPAPAACSCWCGWRSRTSHYKDYFIPKGSLDPRLAHRVAHRMPEVFAEPERFDPDRFAPPREEDKRDFAYIAFGGGRHKCLGNAFAILQIKAILAMLLGQYEFELGGDAVSPTSTAWSSDRRSRAGSSTGAARTPR